LGIRVHPYRGAFAASTQDSAKSGEFHRDTHLTPSKAPNPALHGRRRGVDPTTTDLARLRVERIEGELRSMHVKPGYDRHRGLLYSSGIDQFARTISR
jgi:hypothetical protein